MNGETKTQTETQVGQVDAALSFADCGDSTGGFRTHESLRILASEVCSLRADIAARDALIGELKEALNAAGEFLREWHADFPEHVGDIEAPAVADFAALIARTPSGARAELARLREENARYLTRIQAMYWATGHLIGDELAAVRKLKDERDILRAQLATAEAEHPRGAKMLADNATVWKDRAEAAEARVKDLEQRLENRDAEVRFEMERADNSFKLRLQAEACLRAVTEAADKMRSHLEKVSPSSAAMQKCFAYDAAKSGELPPLWRGKLVRVGTFEQGGETITGFICETTREYIQSIATLRMYEQVTVAGELPPHPDTARLDDLLKLINEAGAGWIKLRYGYEEISRAAIDDAREGGNQS